MYSSSRIFIVFQGRKDGCVYQGDECGIVARKKTLSDFSFGNVPFVTTAGKISCSSLMKKWLYLSAHAGVSLLKREGFLAEENNLLECQ